VSDDEEPMISLPKKQAREPEARQKLAGGVTHRLSEKYVRSPSGAAHADGILGANGVVYWGL
jgi:hypothetical protein